MSLNRTRVALLIPLALAAAAVPHASASNIDGTGDVIVAVIDTGVRVNHTEFTYGGTGLAAAGQFVAWHDFTDEKGAFVLTPTTTWDTRWGPYDNNGHGTGTASRVGGDTLSLNPGAKLAIAKVGKADGTIQSLSEAYDWAVNVVHADVVSISIGSIVPIPGLVDDIDEKIADAMAKGTLTVVSGGNGNGNACGPTFSWLHSNGFSREALAVGSLFDDGATSVLVSCSSFQPDIAAHGYDVTLACHTSDTCYSSGNTGTSFAAPYVAGAAAALLSESITGGNDLGPKYLRNLIVSCVQDSNWPYAIEGAGFFDPGALTAGLPHANAGTLCAPRNVGSAATLKPASKAEQQVATLGKLAWAETTDFEGQTIVPVATASTAVNVIGTSLPVGAFEIEAYTKTLAVGGTFDIDVSWAADGVTDIDVYLMPSTATVSGVILLADQVTRSANGADIAESISFTAASADTYTALIIGWTVLGDKAITVTAPGATFAGQTLNVGEVAA